MPIRRVRSVLTGTVVGGGVMTHYFTDVGSSTIQDQLNQINNWWTDLRTYVTSGVQINVDPVVDTLDETTGTLIGSGSGTGGSFTGLDSDVPNSPVIQGLLRLDTNDIVGGERLRGRLFIPGVGVNRGTSGPSSAYRDGVVAVAATLVTASTGTGPWVVWSRKNGTTRAVENASVWSKWAVLRSRRD